MSRSIMIIFIILFTFPISAMHRMRSPLRFIKPSQLLRPPTIPHAANYARLDIPLIEQCMKDINQSADYRANDRFEENICLIENHVLRHIPIINPRELPKAVDTSSALLHLLAPAHLKHLYLLTNFGNQLKKLTDRKPSVHDTRIYQAALEQPVYLKVNQAYPTRVPGVNDAQLKAILDVAAMKVCLINCEECRRAKQRVFEAFQVYKAVKQLSPGIQELPPVAGPA